MCYRWTNSLDMLVNCRLCRFSCSLSFTFALLLLVSHTALAGTQVTSEESITPQTAATTKGPIAPATDSANNSAWKTTADSSGYTQAVPGPQAQPAYPSQTVSGLPGTPEAGSTGETPAREVNTFDQAVLQPSLTPALPQAKTPAPEVAAPLEEPVQSMLSPTGQAETTVPDPITYEMQPVIQTIPSDVASELVPAAIIPDQIPQEALSEDANSLFTKSLDGVPEAPLTPEAGVSIGEPAPVLTMANVGPGPGQKVVMGPEGANVTTELSAYGSGQGHAFAADRRSLSTNIVLKDISSPSESILATIHAAFRPVFYAGLLLSIGIPAGNTSLVEPEALQDAPSFPLHSPLQGGSSTLSGAGSFSGSVILLLSILLLFLISLLYRARSWTLYESPKPILASHQAPKRPG